MNPISISLIAACVILVDGCQPAEKLPPAKSSATPEVERKTEEIVFRSPTDLREHQALWAQEGWSVHSIVTVTQANGTVLRRAKLSRPKSSAAPPQ